MTPTPIVPRPAGSVTHDDVRCVHTEADRAAEVAELERRADRHFDRCDACRGRRACVVWRAYWRKIVELESGVRP